MAAFPRMLLLVLALGAAPAHAQDKPKDDADELLAAVVQVKAKILPDARSLATLGPQRQGSGVLVREGYVLTIGYLVIEAEAIEVSGAGGKTVPATLAAYDHASGFGLLRLAAPLAARPLPLGDASALAEREPAMIAAHGGAEGLNLVYVVSRRPFSGSWEYQLDAAIYTYPAVQNWSGAALIGPKGDLLGIGSLIVPDAGGPGTQSPGNLFVPIDLLKPILEDLIAKGRSAGPQRPWLGIYAEELRGRLFVQRVAPEGPAERAGLKAGDLVLGVGGEAVGSLAEFYRKLWARGAAGVEVPLRVLQGLQLKELSVRSIDRLEYYRRKPSY
ncbi:MAG TPA: S1C family serine protease [Burkholderiales bacterium]|nr:S1C family serine protease [Burkholderiales bacterium]